VTPAELDRLQGGGTSYTNETAVVDKPEDEAEHDHQGHAH
jgi:hypothetical protein